MAGNYLVCRDNLIQDLELILRTVVVAVVLFSVEGGFIKVKVIFRGWHCHCDCNRPSFQPLWLFCNSLSCPPSLSRLEHNLLHSIYCDNVSRGWEREGGPGTLHSPDFVVLIRILFQSRVWMNKRGRELLFIPRYQLCFLRRWILTLHSRIDKDRRCFASMSDSSLTNNSSETKKEQADFVNLAYI